MNTLTQPLRDEHKELFPHLDQIRQVAELIGDAPIAEIRRGVEEVYDFLANHPQTACRGRRSGALSCRAKSAW